MAAAGSLLDRARFARAAEWLAVAVALSLPWSTSATGILVALWLLALLPTLDLAALRRTIIIPAAAVPAALIALAVLGMTWSGASLADQYGSIKPFLRLLCIPLLFVQYRNSERGMWVVGGFLASCAALCVLSWFLWIWPALSPRAHPFAAIPFKDYIIQSSEFAICAFGMTHLAITAAREGRLGRALALALVALVFLGNIVFVATGRSTLVVMAALLLVLAFQRFDWKGIAGVLVAGAMLAGVAWLSSSYLRARVLAVAQEIQLYQTEHAETASGYRLEFWKKSIRFIAAAPVLGHGTGTVRDLFQAAATGEGPSAAITNQPHNQTFLVAIQLGLAGAALLFAMWISHLLLFRGGGLVAWLGTGVVVQNVVACLFNSYLFEFTMGWIYIFGVGVLGGMMLRGRSSHGHPAP
ncbi:MAG: O-antigen ligase [Alphaproteobacteria bacterium]|nr:O-antigen ligase [Alphaproteobacteria bacterium]